MKSLIILFTLLHSALQMMANNFNDLEKELKEAKEIIDSAITTEIELEDVFLPIEEDTFELCLIHPIEELPKFQGGDLAKFRDYVTEHLKYPQVAIDNNIEGRIFVQFVVTEKGAIDDITFVWGDLGPEVKDECIRVFKSSPKWEPGTQRGIPVKVAFTMPIFFKLDVEETIPLIFEEPAKDTIWEIDLGISL